MEYSQLFINIAFLLNLIALAFREILWIRIILTLAYLLRFGTQYFIYNNFNTSIWMVIFISINMFLIIQILNERRRRHIEPRIVDLFETVFNSLTSYEFLTFWKTGSIKTAESSSVIIADGTRQYSIMLILDGEVKVVKGNKSLTYLTRGNFIGEISFVSKENAIADVVANGPVTYIMWTKKQIETLKRDNNIFWIKLQNILMKDMIGKIKRSNQS